MADNDLKNQLEDLFSDVPFALEPDEREEIPLLREIVSDLLEDEVVIESGPADPTVPEALISIPAELETGKRGESSIIEAAVAGPFEGGIPAEAKIAELARAEVSLHVTEKPEEAKEETRPQAVPICSLEAAPSEQRFRLPNSWSHVLPMLLGLLLLSLLIGLVWLTPIAWSGLRTLYLAVCLVALAITVLQWRFGFSLADALRKSEADYVEIVNSQSQLEEHMEELTTANTRLRERVLQFQKASQVSLAVSPTLEPQKSVQQAVDLVCDRLDLYYVGLFLIDESGRWAVLRAYTLPRVAGAGDELTVTQGTEHAGEFDHPVLTQAYRLEVGGDSIVGQCTANLQTLIAPDLDAEVYHRETTLLPDAHSEMVLPLASGGRVIGALDLQSTQPQAFGREDMDVFQAMANQLATVIDNAQTVTELRTRLDAAEELPRRYRRQQLPEFSVDTGASLYERIRPGVTSFRDKALPNEIQQAMVQQEPVVRADTSSGSRQAALVAPITLRGAAIGALGLQAEHGRQWTADEIALVEDVTTQVALAVENVHLFEQTQAALEESDALYRASRAIALSHSVDGIVHAIVGSLTSPQVDQCFLGIFDSPGGKLSDDLVIVASWAQKAETLWQVGTQLSLNQDLMGERVGRNQPLILSDVAADESLPAAKRHALVAAGACSLAIVPLVAVGGWIGVLVMVTSQVGAITERNLQPYLALAGQAALAIERSSLFRQTQEALEETSMLYRASRAIGSAASVSEVADVLLSSVAEAGFQRGLALMRREVDDKLEIAAGWDRNGHPVQVGAQLDFNYVSPNLTIYSGLAQEDAPSKHRALDGVWRSWVTGGEGAALATIPILFRGSLLGVLLIESRHAGQLSEKALQPFVTLAAQAAVAIENRRLFEETRRAAEEEALLNEMLRNLATALNVHAIIQVVRDSLAELVLFDHMSMALVNEEMSTLEVFHPVDEQAEDDHNLSEGRIVNLQDTLTAQAINSRKTTVFDLADPSLQGLEIETLRQAGAQTCVIIAIVYGQEVLGSLSLGHSSPNAYTITNVLLLERVAQLTAVALENARLFGQLSQRAVQLQTAAQVSHAATSILNLDQLLTETAELIRDRFQLYYVGLFMADGADEWAVLRAGTGEAGQIQLEQKHRLKIGGDSMIGWCMANAKARVALDVGEEAIRFNNPFLPDTRSELALPLISRGETIGALSVQSTSQTAFSREDITTLQTMADQLANAIQNARFFEQTQRALTETEALYRASQRITTSPDLPTLYQILVDEMASRLGADQCRLTIYHHEYGYGEIVAEHPSTSYRPRAPISIAGNPAYVILRDSRGPLAIEDVSAHPAFVAYEDKEARRNVRSMLLVPILVRDELIGSLEIDYVGGQARTLGEAELDFCQTLAGQAAITITNMRAFEEQKETAERLSEMDKLKTQFLANMSHELRTPLNSIIGFSRVILKGIDGPLTEMQETDLNAIYTSGQHLLGLINDILDLSKIEAGKMELNFDEVDLKPIIKGVMSSAVGLVKDRPIELEQHVPDDLPNIWADATRLRQVLLNLVSNATKFTEEGKITLTTDYDDEWITISVIDTGVGIPEEKLETIFEEFTQVDGSATRGVGGTGLGLPISRHFVEMHGGKITVDSQLGVGSTFTVTLPTYTQTEPRMEIAEARKEEESSGAAHRVVLAVDDDPGVISLYRRYLECEGYQVVGLTNSEEVLDRAVELQPFAITLDVLMPAKDGWQVLRELKDCSQTQQIPIVICSIVSNEGLGFSLGAADYLVKPVMEKELLAALERLDQQQEEVEVLVIDDQADDILLIRRMLEARHRYRVIGADGGQAGIDLVYQRKPDIIILDLMMPEVDGFAVLEAVKREQETRDIPVIVITAKELKEEEQLQLTGQVEVLLRKGLFTEHELLEDLGRALSRIESGQPVSQVSEL